MKKIYLEGGGFMAFCVNCGGEITESDVFCPNCGAKNEVSPEETAAAYPQTKEEGIELADKLFTLYKSYERTAKELEDIDYRLHAPAVDAPRQHAAFKFFWPFLIYASVAFTILYIAAILFSQTSYEAAMFFYFLALLSIPILLITGGVRAVRLRSEYNQSEYETFSKTRKQQGLDRNIQDSILRKRQNLLDKTRKYNSIIPYNLRNSAAMSRVKVLLQSGKVENFEDALKLLR